MVYGRYIYTYYGLSTNVHITAGHHLGKLSHESLPLMDDGWFSEEISPWAIQRLRSAIQILIGIHQWEPNHWENGHLTKKNCDLMGIWS